MLTSSRQSAIAAACGLALLAACSKGAPNAAGQTTGQTAHATRQQPANTGNACDRKLLTPADVDGILKDPITGSKPIVGDPQTCRFTTAGLAAISVTLRPVLGRTTVETWKSGRMPVPATPLAGVGDAAVWVGELLEVVAQKNDILCDVRVEAIPTMLRSGSTAVQQKATGQLCNTIFGRIR